MANNNGYSFVAGLKNSD